MFDLGSVLDRLQGVFGKGYVVSGALPVLIGFALSVAIGWSAFPAARDAVAWATAIKGWELTAFSLALILGLGIAGFVYWTVNPWLYGLLEGRVLPASVRDTLTRSQSGQCKALQDAVVKTRDNAVRFRAATSSGDAHSGRGPGPWEAALQKATEAAPTGAVQQMSAEELRAFADLVDARTALQPIAYEKLDHVVELVAAARRGGHTRELGTAISQLRTSLFPFATQVAERAYAAALSARYARYPHDEASVAATRLGNYAEIGREYSYNRYAMDSEVFGPHLLQAAAKDNSFYAMLDNAKLKLDFGVACTVMFGVLTIAWLLAIAVAGTQWRAAAIVAIGGFVATSAFNATTIAAQRGVNALMRALVDLYRFDVLKALHLAAPSGSAEERSLWSTVVGRSEATVADEVRYI